MHLTAILRVNKRWRKVMKNTWDPLPPLPKYHNLLFSLQPLTPVHSKNTVVTCMYFSLCAHSEVIWVSGPSGAFSTLLCRFLSGLCTAQHSPPHTQAVTGSERLLLTCVVLGQGTLLPTIRYVVSYRISFKNVLYPINKIFNPPAYKENYWKQTLDISKCFFFLYWDDGVIPCFQCVDMTNSEGSFPLLNKLFWAYCLLLKFNLLTFR